MFRQDLIQRFKLSIKTETPSEVIEYEQVYYSAIDSGFYERFAADSYCKLEFRVNWLQTVICIGNEKLLSEKTSELMMTWL